MVVNYTEMLYPILEVVPEYYTAQITEQTRTKETIKNFQTTLCSLIVSLRLVCLIICAM